MKKIRGGSSKTRIAICEDCKGKGIIITPGTHIGHGNYKEDTKETCETCEGSGMVKERREVFTIITFYPHKAIHSEV